MNLVKVTPSQLDQILHQIQSASELVDLTEVRARIEAARAWAKVHKQVKEMRLDLLRVEVEALVRVVELDGTETLPARDRKAAKHLAGMTFEDRAAFIARSGTAITTAAGMVRAVWTAENLEIERTKNRKLGEALATHPDIEDNEELRKYVRESTYRIEDVLGEVLSSFGEGEEFTINEMADEVVRAAAIGSTASDPDVEEGIREVCRRAVRRAPVVTMDGTILPRFVTAKSADGHHIRLPVENATLAHLDQMIAGRQEQLAADTARLDELKRASSRLRAIRDDDYARIGDVIATDLATSRSVRRAS